MSDSAKPSPRPILIDPADGPCEICEGWRYANTIKGKPVCNRCTGDLGLYLNMGRNGFQTPGADHFHLIAVNGVPGRECAWGTVCWDCYAKAHKEKYPDLPVPQRPQRIEEIDDAKHAATMKPAEGVVQEMAE